MLYVKIELWPRGDASKAKTLGEALIANTGKGTWTSGSYNALVSKKGGFKSKQIDMQRMQPKHVLREASIDDFPRKRLNAWHLLARVLSKAFDA